MRQSIVQKGVLAVHKLVLGIAQKKGFATNQLELSQDLQIAGSRYRFRAYIIDNYQDDRIRIELIEILLCRMNQCLSVASRANRLLSRSMISKVK